MREIRLSGSTRGEWVCGFFPVRPLSYSTGSGHGRRRFVALSARAGVSGGGPGGGVEVGDGEVSADPGEIRRGGAGTRRRRGDHAADPVS